MFKKIAFAAPLAVLALSSSMAFAAGEARHSISLIAEVPTNGFYVVPVDPDLVNKDQDMSYQPTTGKMGEVNGFFDMINNNGSIHASLDNVPQLYSGSNAINLQVAINGVVLSKTPQMVVGETESNVNFRAPLNIKAISPNIASGSYTGSVNMTFDAVPPVAI